MSGRDGGDPWFARLVDVDPDRAARLAQALATASDEENGLRRTPRLGDILDEVNIPWSVLESLLDEDTAGVVGHPNADRSVVLTALDSASEDVRAAAVASPVLDFSEVEHLYATDKSPAVHFAIARRPDVSERFIDAVLTDPQTDLVACEAVAGSSQLTTDQARRVAEIGIRHAADRSGVGAQILSRLMRHPRTSDEVRAMIALVDALPVDSVNSQDHDEVLERSHITWLYFGLPKTDNDIVDELLAVGHPVALLHEAGTSLVPDDDGASLVRLWISGLTQRALWAAILHRKDAGLIWAPSDFDPSVLMLSVGELRSTDDYEGVDAAEWSEWGLWPAWDGMRPDWVTAASVPLDFSINANYIQSNVWDSSPSELAAYVVGSLFLKGVHLIPMMYNDVTLTETGMEAVVALPEVVDEWYNCEINRSALTPFDWSALSIDRKRTFLTYAVRSLNSASPLVRQVAANTVSLIVLAAGINDEERGLLETDVRPTLTNEQVRECFEFIDNDAGEFDVFSLFYHGCQLKERGLTVRGLELLRTSAVAGFAPSIANIAWNALLLDDFSGLGEIESTALPRMAARAAEQWSEWVQDAWSNVALCRLAVGGSHQQARDTWLGYAERDHLESRFYPAVLAYRDGDEVPAAALARVIPRNDRQTLREEMDEVVESGQGWIRQWGLDALSVLDLVESDGTESSDLQEIIAGPLAAICAEPDHDPDQCPRAAAASDAEVSACDLRAWADAGDSCLKIGLARNPAADSSILEALADDRDLAVRNAVLGRPELPLGILISGLARSYSDENHDDHHQVSAHYNASKMYRDFNRGLADPRLRSIIDLTANEDLLREAWAPVLTWTYFTDVDYADDAHVTRFMVDVVRSVITGAASMDWLHESLLDRTDEAPRVACASVEVTTHLPDGGTRTEVRGSPLNFQAAAAVALRGAEGDFGLAWAQAGPWDVRLFLAQSADTSEEALVEIFQTPVADYDDWGDHEFSAYVGVGIDWEERWPADLGLMDVDDANRLEDFEDDLEDAARACAVLHPNFPESLLADAASDASVAVRAAVARSSRATDQLLRQLAVDSDMYVRSGVSQNARASEETKALAALHEGQ